MKRRLNGRWSRRCGTLTLLVASASACGSSDAAGPGGEAGSTSSPGGEAGASSSPAGAAGSASGPSADTPLDPGTTVTLDVAPGVSGPLLGELALARANDAESLLAAHAVPFQNDLGHDPTMALGLQQIAASPLALNDGELAKLGENGFVILPRKQYPTFAYGYFDIYAADLPVFVSADMVLEAVHRSYDDILKAIEVAGLRPRLLRLLTSMRTRLGSTQAGLSPTAAQDADFFLSVALGLLSPQPVPSVTDLDPAEVRKVVQLATEADAAEALVLFGANRTIDFSQFKPRGHYMDSEDLERYFRAMMWLGRIDLRFIETQADGSRKFWRRQVETALALGALMDAPAEEDWRAIDATTGAFVGERDYMAVPELDLLLGALGSTREEGLGERTDEAVAQAIVDGQYGEQRIASQIVSRMPSADGPLPLDASFALFGQRYTVDSHVFSNVVFDRVRTRVLPNPLDAAFAAFGNDQAVSLLEQELTERPYAGALAAMHALVEAHPSAYWQSSLYTSWLGALRTLSPRVDGGVAGSAGAPAASGLPAVARTQAWGRRLLNTQLASWAELRHDTILYAKQSYTAGSVCEFPDAYVEPYPEFFHALVRYAELGESVVTGLGLAADDAPLAEGIVSYFQALARIAGTLGEMAELQRTGMPHTPEHVAFINQAIRVSSGGSGPPFQTGWYKDLFYDTATALDLDPTIADVHTDVGGDAPFVRLPSVLHVGTGMPRAMIVSVDTCEGARAYAGVVFAYHESVEPGLTRLDDEQWLERLFASTARDVSWLQPVLAAPGP